MNRCPGTHPKYPERLKVMHLMFGKREDETCKNCVHLIRYHQGASWLKCDLTIQTGSNATDWRAGWTACGKFEKGGTDLSDEEKWRNTMGEGREGER